MRKYLVTISSTRTDTQGEQVTRSALESAARMLNTYYIRVGRGHDPRLPPLGRIGSAQVEPIGEGHFVLGAELEIWDDTDQPAGIAGDGRTLAPEEEPENAFDVEYDLPAAADLGLIFFQELARIAGPEAKPRYNAKKAVEPLSAIVIAIGAFVLGGIATGFLAKVGEDVYEALKAKLKATTKSHPGRERPLVVRTAVNVNRQKVGVELVLTNSTDPEIEWLFSSGFMKLDAVVKATLESTPEAREIVAECAGGDIRVLYWLRPNGVPSVIKSVHHEELMTLGLSLSAIVTDREEKNSGDPAQHRVQPTRKQPCAADAEPLGSIGNALRREKHANPT
jgi:hypothetical protein